MNSKLKYFMNNFFAEWTRLWSVRSSWFFALCTICGVIGVSYLISVEAGANAPAGGTPWEFASIIGLPALFGSLILFTIAATADHATGNITPTLQWTPQRGTVLAARTCVIVLGATLFGVVLVALAAAILTLNAPQLILFSDKGARVLGNVALVYSSVMLLAVGLSLLTRNTAAALSAVFGLILILPLMLQLLPFTWATSAIEFLPGSGAMYFLIGEGPGDTIMNRFNSIVTLSVWAVGTFIAGSWRLLYTDAN